VTWDGTDDPSNPRNWSAGRKWLVTFVASSFSFITPLSSSMISPALPAINEELQINSGILELMVISIYVLGFAVGPLVLGPLSEVYGRKIVLQVANVVFLIFNTACGGCTSTAQLFVFRFLSGLGGSAPLAVSICLRLMRDMVTDYQN
jgi:MFS family permease